ncbi:MAG TPA: hypothetical protein VFV02_15100, partial [Acidimicrobiales bacterium]|nr:hypothetical protein [Acidimicrobiales bacterium]
MARSATRQVSELDLIAEGRHSDPHRILGKHGTVVRAFRPGANAMRVILGSDGSSKPVAMVRVHDAGVFEGSLGADVEDYELEADYVDGDETITYRYCDPYRAWPTLGELDLHLFGEGRHHRLWEVLGAHPRVHDGMAGVSFAVWAPNASAVRLVGDWNFWDGRVHQMRSLGSSGVWEL